MLLLYVYINMYLGTYLFSNSDRAFIMQEKLFMKYMICFQSVIFILLYLLSRFLFVVDAFFSYL